MNEETVVEPIASTSGGKLPEPIPSTSGIQTSPSNKRKNGDESPQQSKKRVSNLINFK